MSATTVQQPLSSYLGLPALKAALLVEIEKHEAADAITKGTYGRMNGQWRGCAIGCSLRSLNIVQGKLQPNDATDAHARYPAELGLPLWLAHCEDSIFEQLPDDLAKTWPRRFAEAVPVGVDLTPLLANAMHWVLVADTYGVIHAAKSQNVKAIVQRMADLFARAIAGAPPPEAEWNEAGRDAWDAWHARAARAAWDARAAWAARAANAWDARDAWDAWDARDDFYPALSEHLLGLLRSAQ